MDYIVNNNQLLGVVKTLSPKDLYVLIDMFNLDELNWMKDSCNVEDSCSFREMLHYCVFFKIMNLDILGISIKILTSYFIQLKVLII